jgi:hypothetical protein
LLDEEKKRRFRSHSRRLAFGFRDHKNQDCASLQEGGTCGVFRNFFEVSGKDGRIFGRETPVEALPYRCGLQKTPHRPLSPAREPGPLQRKKGGGFQANPAPKPGLEARFFRKKSLCDSSPQDRANTLSKPMKNKIYEINHRTRSGVSQHRFWVVVEEEPGREEVLAAPFSRWPRATMDGEVEIPRPDRMHSGVVQVWALRPLARSVLLEGEYVGEIDAPGESSIHSIRRFLVTGQEREMPPLAKWGPDIRMFDAAARRWLEDSMAEDRAQFAHILPKTDDPEPPPTSPANGKSQRMTAAFLIKPMSVDPRHLFFLGHPSHFVL